MKVNIVDAMFGGVQDFNTLLFVWKKMRFISMLFVKKACDAHHPDFP